MGSIRKIGDSYQIDYRVQGRRIRKFVGHDKRLAEIALQRIEVKIARNELSFFNQEASLEQLFNDFLKFSRTNHTPSTTKRYSAVINNFRTFLKAEYPHLIKPSRLNPAIFEDYKIFRMRENGAKGNGYCCAKPHTVNFEIKVLRAIFNLGIEYGLIDANPTKRVRFLKERTSKAPRFFTEKECALFLDNCGEKLYPVFFTFLHTGLRRDELRFLEWKDIDFERKVIKIRYKDDWHPKTDEREVPMNPHLCGLLQGMDNDVGRRGYVFRDNGKIWPTNKLRRRLMSITKKCGMPDVTKLHTLRHTFASHLVMKGVDLPSVQKLMGHSDIQTTMIYSHLSKEHLAVAVDKLSY